MQSSAVALKRVTSARSAGVAVIVTRTLGSIPDQQQLRSRSSSALTRAAAATGLPPHASIACPTQCTASPHGHARPRASPIDALVRPGPAFSGGNERSRWGWRRAARRNDRPTGRPRRMTLSSPTQGTAAAPPASHALAPSECPACAHARTHAGSSGGVGPATASLPHLLPTYLPSYSPTYRVRACTPRNTYGYSQFRSYPRSASLCFAHL